MPKIVNLILLTLGWLLLAFLAYQIFAGGVQNQEAGPDLAEGKEIFQSYCAKCHGPNGIGQDPTQPLGGLDAQGKILAPALDGTGHAWHHAPALLEQIVTQGSANANSPMVGFGGLLTQRQIGNVIAYFQSLWSAEIKAQYQASFPEP